MSHAAARKTHSMDMCSGPILPKLLAFSLPLMLSGILQLFFNAADVIVVGKFCGDLSLAAVTSNGSLAALLVNLFIGLSVGVNVLAARAFGAKNDTALEKTVHTAILVGFFSGVIVMTLGVSLSPTFLRLMNTPENVLPLATLYLRIFFCGTIPNLIYNFGAALLRAVGDTRRPMLILTLSGVLNVLLNLIFVTVFHMDVAGVALASIIAQTNSGVLMILCLLREEGAMKLHPRRIRIDGETLMQIFRIGLPAGIQSILFSLANTVIQGTVNSFGDTVMSGSGAAHNLEGFVYAAMHAFYQASISFVSQNYARKNYRRIVKILILSFVLVVAVGAMLGLFLNIFGVPLLRIYSQTDAVIAEGLTRLRIIAATYFLCGAMEIFSGGLRGIGYSVLPTIVTLIGSCGLRLLWITAAVPMNPVIWFVYLAFPISWILTALTQLVFLVILLRKKAAEAAKNTDE